MTVTVTSSAALAKLTVPTPFFEKDVVLKIVVGLASDKQLEVKQTKKGNEMKLELVVGNAEITHRAAILRALAGPVLHYALDNELLGGHGAKSKNAGCTKSVLALSSLRSWMTVADQLQTGAIDRYNVIAQLDNFLQSKSFLVPSHQATLADFEVCFALLKGDDNDFPRYVLRWMSTVHAQMISLGATNLPSLPSSTETIPVFFYGTEDFVPAAKKNSGTEGGLTEEQNKVAAEKKAKKENEKAMKKNENSPAPAPAPATSDVDITALDIRVGRIVKAWHHQEAEKLFCEEIDVGEDKPRQIASGLRPFYKTEDLENRHVLVLCNLKARNLVGFPSHGMVLCASNVDHTQVEFVVPPSDTPIGERVVFGGLEGEPEPENKIAKKKILEKLLPDLKTNEDGTVIWKEYEARTSKGTVKALNGMANASVA